MATRKGSNSTPTQDNAPIGPRDAFAPPRVPAIMDPGDPTGLIHRNSTLVPLEVEFDSWERSTGPNRTDWVVLGFTHQGGAFREVARRSYPSITEVVFPQRMHVPVEFLSTEGAYSASITVRLGSWEAAPKESLRTRVSIDLKSPNFGEKPLAPVFPDELGGIVTEQYLVDHGGVWLKIPWHADAQVGDVVIFYFTDDPNNPATPVPVGTYTLNQGDVNNKQLSFFLDAAVIRSQGQGLHFAQYRLRDRAGNTNTETSDAASIQVNLTPLPGSLPPPWVPLSTRGLIDRQHARDLVFVVIDPYLPAEPEDWIAVSWDGSPLHEVHVETGGGLPLEIPVPWLALSAQGLGPANAMVNYRVRRNGVYTPPSPTIAVPYDFTIAGQDHVDAPALLNKKLALIEVRGLASNIPNMLTGADFGLPAKATLRLYDNPIPGETIELYWGAIPTPVYTYTVKFGDGGGDIIEEFVIAWEFIELDKNNAHLPVRYLTNNGVNQQLSLTTPVNVSIIVIENLKEPVFRDKSFFHKIECDTVPRPWQGIRVQIKPDIRFAENDLITLVWQGCRNSNGSDPIDGTDAEIPHKLSAHEAQYGFDFIVSDWEKLIKPMQDNGSAVIYYRLLKTTGAVGSSTYVHVIINHTWPSGCVCSPTNECHVTPPLRV